MRLSRYQFGDFELDPASRELSRRGERIALETPLEAAESVDAGSMPRRAFDAATEWVGGLLRSGVKKL